MSGDDDPREFPARRGYSVSYKGKTLLSRIDPVAQGERVATEIPVKDRTLYFCPSPIYGYGLSLLLQRLPKDSVILCVEADDRLFEISKKAITELIESSPGKNLAFVQLSDAENLCTFVNETWGRRRFRRIEMLRLTGGSQLFPLLYEDLANLLRRELAVEWGNAMTLIRLGRLYSRNLIRNLALLAKGESLAALDFGASPVLVLGAGPSLDPLLDGLSALGEIGRPDKRNFVIVCVDTCLPALHERGILPDLAVILESQHWNLRDFSGAFGRKIDAALDLSALPSSGRVLAGKRYFFATPWTELSLFTRLEEAGLLPETLPPLGSVGLSAVALALRAGTGPVLSGGIDFSFILDAYHARSTPGHSDLLRRQNRLNSIVNAAAAFREGTFTTFSKTGTRVRSDPAMRNYRNLFEQEFGGNPRLFDITGQGLPLGARTVPVSGAFAILNAGRKEIQNNASDNASNNTGVGGSEKIGGFIRREIDTLKTLRETLSGGTAPARLEALLGLVDYLWAHFPEYAGLDNPKPSCSDFGFLKRVRTEIEPFLKIWEMTEEIAKP